MSLYLIKIFILLLFSAFVGYNFYFGTPSHISNFDGYAPYFIFAIILYGIYKYIQISFNRKETTISLKSTLLLFFMNLFAMCFYFFSISGWSAINGFSLFFRIVGYLILPTLIFSICSSFGNFIITKLFKEEKNITATSWLFDLVIGFVSFITLLVIFGFFGLYNIFVVFIILAVFAFFSYKQLIALYKKLFFIEFKFEDSKIGKAKLYITELFYFVAFIALGVGLISIVRPFPIGWDDLGVYMNFPRLMAQNGGLLSLGGMYAWQVYTGIGFMFHLPTQAFFLNFSGIILCFIGLNIILGDLIKGDKKTILNLPIILSTIFVALPMVMFQTSKDLKVDEGLFFISIVVLYFVYKFYLVLEEKNKKSLIYLFIFGIIAGFCFSVKFTSLLLIISILAVISYARLGINGFLGYIGVFLGIFTLGNFWSIMNVVINISSTPNLERNVGIGLIIIGLIFYAVALFRKKQIVLPYIKEVGVFVLGVVVILLPWFGKNISESYPNISILGIVSGKSDHYYPDYTKLYSQEEINSIKELYSKERQQTNVVTTDEDLLRYLGYDNGILNHINMFWNLTMQKNQAGEYTNIGFLFLALLPLIFIFLPYKNKYYFIFFIVIAFGQVLFYVLPGSKFIDEAKLEKIDSKNWESLVKNNDEVFLDKRFNKDIYDIKVSNYYSESDLLYSLSETEDIKAKAMLIAQEDGDLNNYEYHLNSIIKQEYAEYEKNVNNIFYLEIKEKVIDPTIGDSLKIFEDDLEANDFKYIEYLHQLYSKNKMFVASDIIDFKASLKGLGLEDSVQNELIELWNGSRTISGKITDFFAKINLPVGYVYIFFGFLIPTLYLLFTLKDTSLNALFKLNLVFASLYIFLWMISSFGIVWYGITMYFSFLLMIGLGAYYISSVKEDADSKKYIAKIIGSGIFLGIVLINIFFSTIPYLFTNLKEASYLDYKSGMLSTDSAIFRYQSDTQDILFALNIDESKKKEFLHENIDSSIYKLIDLDEYEKFSDVVSILISLEKQNNQYSKVATKSLENLFSGIANPKKEYKNKELIYRIGTFLRYHISENNSRFFDDTMLYGYNDYIYSENTDETINRLEKLGVKYMLIDLNAATIDQSILHDLTNRYEKLLELFTSNKLELVGTDSICLKLALELYPANKDMKEFMTLAGVNFDSYDENGEVIARGEKKYTCLQYVDQILDKNLVTEDEFSYLIPYKNYFETNQKNMNTLNGVIGNSYRALFIIR